MKNRYQDWSEDELFLHLKENPRIEAEFYRRYKRQVRWILKDYHLNSEEREDLIQEGMIGLFSAIENFDPSRNIKFSTYSLVCIRNKINTVLRSMIKRNRKEESTEDIEAVDGIQMREAFADPEGNYFLEEVSEELKQMILNLKDLEKQVLIRYLDKRSYSEIAKDLAISNKKVDNILMKIKANLAKKINESQLDLPDYHWGSRLKNSLHKGLSDENES